MEPLVYLFLTAFVIGLSGALSPGPVLTATISEVMKRGFWAGPLIVLGHAMLEFLLLLAIVAGLGNFLRIPIVLRTMGTVGGVVLIIMGTQLFLTARHAAAQFYEARAENKAAVHGPIITGILTSLAHPFWILWWVVIGLRLVTDALHQGWLGLGAFYTGHILADLLWYTLVAAAVSSGRRICPPKVYRGMIRVCGVALCLFGLYFLYAAFTDSLLFAAEI